MNIAVTGATGHIGANLLPALVEAGHKVRGIFRKPDHRVPLNGLPVDWLQGDILDAASLEEFFNGMDAVIHLAAVISIDGDPGGRVMRTNVEGTRNVVEACKKTGVQRFIHFSSIDAVQYSKREPVIDEATPLVDDHSFPYRVSKRRSEEVVWEGVKKGLSAIILSPTAVIGPRDFHISASGQMLRDLFANRLPALVDDGFDWVDVRDVVQASLAALESPKLNERYLLPGHWASTPQLSALCRRISGRRTPRLTLPLWTAYLGLPFLRLHARLTGERPLYTAESLRLLRDSNRNFSCAKAARDLGYRPRPLEESIRDVYAWYVEEGIF